MIWVTKLHLTIESPTFQMRGRRRQVGFGFYNAHGGLAMPSWAAKPRKFLNEMVEKNRIRKPTRG